MINFPPNNVSQESRILLHTHKLAHETNGRARHRAGDVAVGDRVPEKVHFPGPKDRARIILPVIAERRYYYGTGGDRD